MVILNFLFLRTKQMLYTWEQNGKLVINRNEKVYRNFPLRFRIKREERENFSFHTRYACISQLAYCCWISDISQERKVTLTKNAINSHSGAQKCILPNYIYTSTYSFVFLTIASSSCASDCSSTLSCRQRGKKRKTRKKKFSFEDDDALFFFLFLRVFLLRTMNNNTHIHTAKNSNVRLLLLSCLSYDSCR